MKQFDTVDMASGGIALILEPFAKWEQFPDFCEKWSKLFNAKLLSPATVSFDECLLELQIADGQFWISYDDFQSSIQLEPRSPNFNHIIIELQKKFRD